MSHYGDPRYFQTIGKVDLMDTQEPKTCRYHPDSLVVEAEEYCSICLDVVETLAHGGCDVHSEIVAKLLSIPKQRLLWHLTHDRLSATHPHLLREAGLWQSSYLLSFFGEDALTGLATYFSSLGDDLRERCGKRDRATRLASAEQSETIRQLYPPEQYAKRRQNEANETPLDELL